MLKNSNHAGVSEKSGFFKLVTAAVILAALAAAGAGYHLLNGKKSAVVSEGTTCEFDCNGVPLEMVSLPEGSFRRGDGRVISLTRGFWMGKFEVTQAQYEAVTGVNPSHFRGSRRPVEQVSWSEAKIFCDKLTGSVPENFPPVTNSICRPKPSGSTPAAQERRLIFRMAMIPTQRK